VVQSAATIWLHTTLDQHLFMRKETEGSIMILYGIKWKCKEPSNATHSETA
jgi:hypothetical protein